jgi:predicted DNA-binding transcriptional regulator AlpA
MENAETLLLPKQAAEKLKLTAATLQRYRSEGGGPLFVKIGRRRVAYRNSDLSEWLAARTANSTADAKSRGLL